MRVMLLRRSKPVVRAILLLCFACVAVRAVAQRYPILAVPGSPPQIDTFFQDSKGMVWIGTDDDLLCFDGERFYSTHALGFPTEHVTSIAEDSEGGIWAATRMGSVQTKEGPRYTGGLYRLQGGHVQRISALGHASIVRVAPGIMLATLATDHRFEYNDLYRVREQADGWKPELLLPNIAGELRVDHGGNVVFPCPAGWCEIARPQLLAKQTAGLRPVQHSFSSNGHALHVVLRDRFGCVWGRSDSESFYGCAPDGAITRLAAPWNGSSGNNYVLQEAPDGRVLLMSGAAIVYGRPESPAVIPGDKLPVGTWKGFVTEDGTIWFTAQNARLYRFLYPLRLEYWNENDGISYQGELLRVAGRLFSAGDGGIFSLDADRKRWHPLTGSKALGQVTALAAGPGGTLYAAGYGPTVSQITTDGKILATSKTDDFGMTLATDDTGRLWLGAGKGIFQVKRSGDTLETVSQGFTLQGTAMKFDRSRKILWAYDNEEIVGTRTALRGSAWWHINQKDGLPTNFGVGLTVLPNGDIWAANASPTFTRVQNPERAAGRPPTVTNFEGSPGTTNNFLDSDRRGWLWRCTNIEDLYLATADEAQGGAWLRFGMADGLPVQGGGRSSFLNDTDGSVWYSASNSIIHFDPPDDFLTRFPRPKIALAGFSVGNAAPVLAAALGKVPHGEDLVAHVGSLQFDRRSALRLRWRLLPEQAAWQTGSKLDLHLGKLHWGSHSLQVQAQMGIGTTAGPWSEMVEQSFYVMLPVWLQWRFLCGFFTALALLIFAVRLWRRKLRERAEKILPELAAWRLEALSSELSQLEGTRLDGRFAVGELLARGGFASVLHGTDLAHGGRPCAIKIFRQELRDKDWMARRFQQEVAALKQIDHPNVIAIYGSGQLASGASYLVMEFVDGETLRERLQAGKIARQQAATYLRQLGSALRAIHAREICHRDVKPENVMMRRDAELGRELGRELVLIDFSIAIVKDPDETMYGLSRAAGTLNYMAPEQAIGYADASTDIYSLAKILIEMLTGERLSALLPDASMDLPERVRGLLRGLELGLSAASIERIAQALEFDPARRPKDAYAFASEIADDLHGHG